METGANIHAKGNKILRNLEIIAAAAILTAGVCLNSEKINSGVEYITSKIYQLGANIIYSEESFNNYFLSKYNEFKK